MKGTLGFGFALFLLGAAAAHATTFELSFASAADQSALGGDGEPGFSGSATLFGTELSPGHYNITAATGTTITDPNFADQNYAYVANPTPLSVSDSPDGFLTYDGALFDGSPSLSQNGLLWVGVNNGADENIFSFEGLYIMLDVWDQASPDGASEAASVVDLSVTAVPEPSTWALISIGFAAAGFAGYRASRKSPVQAASVNISGGHWTEPAKFASPVFCFATSLVGAALRQVLKLTTNGQRRLKKKKKKKKKMDSGGRRRAVRLRRAWRSGGHAHVRKRIIRSGGACHSRPSPTIAPCEHAFLESRCIGKASNIAGLAVAIVERRLRDCRAARSAVRSDQIAIHLLDNLVRAGGRHASEASEENSENSFHG